MRPALDKAQAIARGMTTGAIAASKATGIPRRTISRWLAEGDVGSSPVVTAAIVATEEAIAARLWETMQLGLEEVRLGLLDPAARLSDKSRALEVVASQWALLTGRATSRSESANVNVNVDGTGDGLTDDERTDLRRWLTDNIAALEAAEEAPNG